MLALRLLTIRDWPVVALAAALLLLAAACGTGDYVARPAANPTLAPTAAGGSNAANPSPTIAPPPTAATTAAAANPIPTAAPIPTNTRPAPPIPTLAPETAAIPTAAPTPANTRPAPPSSTLEPETAPTLLQLADPLDEPEFYCVDVPGFRDSLRTDRPLQAHTCKPNAADELFIADRPETGQFLMPAYDLCMTAEEGQVYTRPCVNTPAQQFVHREDLTIGPAGEDLCLAVAGGQGEPAGGRSHLRRDLQLLPCSGVEPALSQWIMPGGRPRS